MGAKPYRILIIEDSPEDRELYRRRIALGQEQDYDFWETGSAEEGLRLCQEVIPDCVLLDYQLPDADGLEFLDRFPAAVDGAKIPIIMLTGHGNEAVAVQAMKKGIHDYLVKGLNSYGLRQVVHSAIDQGLLRRQIEAQRLELEEQAAALAEANRRKDDFLAMLAHELRNPLAPLRNSLHVLRLRGGLDPEALEASMIMERQVIHLARLVDDLLDVSRINRGRIELRKESVDLLAAVRGAVEACRSDLEGRRHELTVDLPPTPVFVNADAVRLEQILTNLLNNASKYTDPGGRIGLTVACEAGHPVVRVRDNGLGIPAELLPHVFDLFTQGSRSLDRAQGGLGIGLTLVKSLVELHGGTVSAFSDGPYQGSEFVVRLPAAIRPPPALPTAPSGRVPMRRSLRLLVVDDNTDAADTLAKFLRMGRHEVQVAYDGPAALQRSINFRPHVVLLDIGLPGLDGYEVARRLRAQPETRRTVLIALTGYGQESDKERARENGFDHHLVKPVDPDELLRLLAQTAET